MNRSRNFFLICLQFLIYFFTMNYLIERFRIFKRRFFGLEAPYTAAFSSSSSSGATTSSVRGEGKYDVFLSFRGEDTRNNFTDHLYHALCNALIGTFLDDRKIETGDELKPELEAGIRRSKASIIVISENYATSTWCLNELALILEEKEKDKNRIVIPIFYHVDPSDVRKLQGSFGKAMRRHRMNKCAKNQGLMQVYRWEAALRAVANLKGRAVNGSEWNFIQSIVREISERLGRNATNPNLPLLIGRKDLVGEINSWLANGSSNAADILIICGIAGIGKTTLARYIYESNIRERRFDGGSFLQDIGSRASQPNIMLELQEKLLKDVGILISERISDVSSGTEKIQEALKGKKLLLVLDDVNDVEQVNSLLGKERLRPGTKVIITTNNMSWPRRSIEVCNRPDNIQSNYNYEERLLEGLSEDASLELLCKHAFKSDCPDEGFEEVSRKVAAYCGGHPKALKCLGESLSSHKIPGWEDALRIWRTQFSSIIREALKVSFDLLRENKDIDVFKIVACFFVGEERNCVETVLDASFQIQNLINCCLLTVDPQSNCLKMDQLIQERGRDMVRQGLDKNLCDRSRLWCHDECFNVLRRRKINKDTGDIKGLLLDMKMLNQENLVLKTGAVKQMKSLELLKLNFVRLKGSYNRFPRSLKWLCWHGFPLKYIPSRLEMKALVALDMSYSRLKLWDPCKELPALKILDLSWCTELISFPPFSKHPILERLTLRGCTSLVEVGESIEDHEHIVFVDISWCERLSNLPRSLPKLKRLKTLLLDGCPIQDEMMATSPRSLFAHSFPADFSKLKSLETLDLSNTSIRSLPDCVRSLSGIKTLLVQSCEYLESLCLPSTVVVLNVQQCKSLKKVTLQPDKSPVLRLVEKSHCDQLTEVQGFFKIDSVNEVKEEVINSLGWCDLRFVRNLVTRRWDFISSSKMVPNNPAETNRSKIPSRSEVPKNVPAEVVYEFGIFSTWFLGERIPDWFEGHKSKEASISFIVPSGIRGLNVCSAHRVLYELLHKSSRQVKINNATKNLTWIYEPQEWFNDELPLGRQCEDMVLLTHWRFGNQLQKDDKVTISIFDDYYGEEIKEVGINFVYTHDPFDYYSSDCWKHIIGRDLHRFQLPTGEYHLKSQRLLNAL